MIRMGLVGAGYALLPSDGRWSPERSAFADSEPPTSPSTTPFVRPLPRPPKAQKVPPFYNLPNGVGPQVPGLPPPSDEHAQFLGPETRYFHVVAEERLHSFDPKIPDTLIWGYRDATVGAWPYGVGPILGGRFGFTALGAGMMVRHENQLPAYHTGFGVPITTVHFHGGHQLATSDGFPTNINGFPDFLTMPRSRPSSAFGYFDHCFPLTDPGFMDYYTGKSTKRPDVSERPSTLWYHDHLLGFTAQNVYRGLAGVAMMFDDLDTGVEEDPDTEALRLPSGLFDIPLVIQDKRFNRDGSPWFDTFDHDGFIGDKFLVNGAVQPYLEVQRRKYRFRFLNASNARIYQFFLTDDLRHTFSMTQIATEGGLLAEPIPNVQSFQIGMAERIEVVIDFTNLPGETFYMENRLQQTEGRKPDGLASRGTRILQFKVTGPGVAVDNSRVGKWDGSKVVLRSFDPIKTEVLQKAVRRTFVFDRSDGAWTINGKLAGDLERPMASPLRDGPEIWRLVNDSGGWWHPVHVHSEFGRVLKRNGRIPPAGERDGMAKKDTYLLRGDESVEVFFQFRDYKGPFTFHCHNLGHEDMDMMARFDVVDA